VEGQNLENRQFLHKYEMILEGQRLSMREQREAILVGATPSSSELERLMSLNTIDDLWSEHLASVKELQEGTQWISYGGGEPLYEYLKAIHKLFENLQARITEEISSCVAEAGTSSFDPAARGATWTYITTDQPYGSLGQRFVARFSRRVLVPMLAPVSRTVMGRTAKLLQFAGLVLIAGLASHYLSPWIVRHLGKPSLPAWQFWATVVIWLLFSIYWEIAAKNSASVASVESRGSRRLHVFLANAALILILVPVHGLRQRCLPVSSIVIAAGLIIEATGLLLAVWARRHLGRNWSGEISIKRDHQLVRSGPYHVVRHPIYTALLAMYLGSAVVSGELHALFGLALAAIAYVHKVRLEEAVLAQFFGEEYRDYRRVTWALLPGLF